MYDRTSVNGADTGRWCLTWYRLQSPSGQGYNLGLILPSPADWKRSWCSFNAITLPLGARHSATTSSSTASMAVHYPDHPSSLCCLWTHTRADTYDLIWGWANTWLDRNANSAANVNEKLSPVSQLLGGGALTPNKIIEGGTCPRAPPPEVYAYDYYY